MTVYDFINLMTDDSVEIAIYDFTTETEIFKGEARDAMYEDYSYCEVQSFDIDTMSKRGIFLILNVETECDD